MYIPNRRDRRRRRVGLLLGAVFVTFIGLLSGWISIDEARGGVVDAEVVGVRHISSGRRVYDVRFDAAGRACSTRVDSGSSPKPRDVHAGGTSRLRYSASDPCIKVRETGGPSPGPLPVVAPVVAAGLWVGVWRLRPGGGRSKPGRIRRQPGLVTFFESAGQSAVARVAIRVSAK
ncbi:hypothetical protein [Dactylosporangium sp. NPDC050588]|uniref:hypothetical protein n=1 Tax=Dactylosporangium sp. NPDC050588 TaxID=3157211 RepID=UPI0033CE29E4